MSGAGFEPGTLTYTDRRIGFYSNVVEQWKADHLEASICYEVEQYLRDVSLVLEDIFAADSHFQREVFSGRQHDPATAVAIEAQLARWVELAESCEHFVRVLHGRGYEVEGVLKFRATLAEGRAALHPDDGLPTAVAAVRDAAVAEQHAGGTEPWQ